MHIVKPMIKNQSNATNLKLAQKMKLCVHTIGVSSITYIKNLNTVTRNTVVMLRTKELYNVTQSTIMLLKV